MISVQSVSLTTLEPQSATNGASVTQVLDCLGADYATIVASFSHSNNSTNVASTCKVQEADVTNTSSFADISGSSFTSTYTAANTSTQDNLLWGIDLKARKRYLRVSLTPITTQTIAVTAILSRLENTPLSSSAYGTAAAPLFL